jgi:general secretion pathway protein J
MTRQNAGFTLIELLVALSLFAMISIASLALLRSSIDTQGALAGRMDRSAGVERLRALMADGLLAAQPQAMRSAGQAATPAFIGASDRISFMHAAPGPSGALVITRMTLAAADGQLTLVRGDAAGAERAILIDNLAAAAFRYRDETGAWQAAWTPARANALPRAAELTIQRRGEPEILMRFLVAPDWPVAQQAPA